MQVSICCSARSAVLAGRLRDRLARNLGIQTLLISEESEPMTAYWEEGSAVDAQLILLDRDSAPPPFRREAWEGILEHSEEPPLAFWKVEECAYPKLLERRPFFAADDAERGFERWVASMLPGESGLTIAAVEAEVPAKWWAELVDRPGVVTAGPEWADAAQQFAHLASGHFRRIEWIGCGGRHRASIQDDLEVAANSERTLAILAHTTEELELPPGRHSFLVLRGALPAAEGSEDTLKAAAGACFAPRFPGWLAREIAGANGPLPAVLLDGRRDLYRLRQALPSDHFARQRHLAIVAGCFQRWKKEPEKCRELLGELTGALDFGFEHDWKLAGVLCQRAAFLFLADGYRRQARIYFRKLLREALRRDDTDLADEARHELSWLEEGRALPRTPVVEPEAPAAQLSLFGGEF